MFIKKKKVHLNYINNIFYLFNVFTLLTSFCFNSIVTPTYALANTDPCAGVNTNTTNLNPDSQLAQKGQYCQAAQSYDSASKTDKILMATWAGVAGICLIQCANKAAVLSAYQVCTVAQAGAGITEGILTKDLANTFQSLSGVGMTLLMGNQNSAGAKTAGEDAGKTATKSADIMACMDAAMAAVQVYTEHSAMVSDSNLAAQNRTYATQIQNSSANSNLTASLSGAAATATTLQNTLPISTTGGGGAGATASSGSAAATACSGASSSSGNTSLLECAVASDSNLPGGVNSSNFANDLKNNGINLGDLMNKSPEQALATAAMEGGFNPEQSTEIMAALDTLDQGMMASDDTPMDTAGGYTASGGGGAKKGNEGDPAMNALLDSMMQKFGMKKGQKLEEHLDGMGTVIYANKTRSPASIVEDKTISIFDRVSFRYYFFGEKLAKMGN